MGLSLWLVPSEEDAERLQTIMKPRQTKSEHSPSSYPVFYPHVTLGSFSSPHPSISDISPAIPKYSHGIPVQFKSVEIGTHYFRSVYVAITLTPALTALHEEVHRRLNIEPRTPAFPHFSLCYIADEDAQLGERDNFLRELKVSGRISEATEESRISLNCDGTSEDVLQMSEFLATEVWVANCSGPVESWEVIQKIPLIRDGGA